MTTTDQTIRNYSVPGISCGHCKAAIEGEVTKISGVTGIDVDIDAKTVVVTGGDDSAIRDAIDEAGYDVA
jgi:copper chaperone